VLRPDEARHHAVYKSVDLHIFLLGCLYGARKAYSTGNFP
jgi:hypothetical protein